MRRTTPGGPSMSSHPPQPSTGPLAILWNEPVNKLVSVPSPSLPEGEKERHRLYCLLIMSLVCEYWNGNKLGRTGNYPLRKQQLLTDGVTYAGGDYLGHNIASIAVDGYGYVIDFDFNHNEVYNSSVDHAQSRLDR